MFIEPIARFKSPFKTKFGIPRQAGLVPELKGRIVFEPGFRSVDAVRGLEWFDYIWLIWGFSGNKARSVAEHTASVTEHTASVAEHTASVAEPVEATEPVKVTEPPVPVTEPAEVTESAEATSPLSGTLRQAQRPKSAAHRPESAFQATVRPPRLGGNERIGVFASRSPFRPNGLGLSSVRIESIEYYAKDPDGKPVGPVINVLGADLMDGTPIYDIKPYVTYADSHPDASSGFVDDREWKPLKVVFALSVTSTGSVTGDGAGAQNASVTELVEVTEPAEVTVQSWTEADVEALREVLAQDPRPRYQNDPDKVYGMIFNNMDVRFKVDGDVLTVVEIKPQKDND